MLPLPNKLQANTVQPDEVSITWTQVANDCIRLAEILRKDKFDGILAVARGGMIPASLIGRILGIRKFEVLVVESYSGREKSDVFIRNQPKIVAGRWLIVDELTDSGGTAVALKKLFPQYPLAVLYVKTAGRNQANYYVREYDDSTWLVFPWERIKE